MTSSQKNLSFISWQLLSELDEMKHDQYAWLMQARENLLDNWKDYRARYRSWRRKVDGLVDDLAQKGDAEGASWLTQTLLRDPIISNPAEFELTIPTGNGSEVIHVRGCPDQPAAVTAQQPPPSVPGLDAVEVQLPLPPPAAALGSDAAAKVVKKKRGQPQSAIPQSAAEDAEDPVSEHEQNPTDAITESHVTTRAQSSCTKRKKTTQHAPRKKTAQQALRKKIARRASPEPKKRSPGRPPSKSAITQEVDPECPYSSWTLIRLREEVRARSATAPIRRLKAELIDFLMQNDKDEENDPTDASESAQDDEASTSNTTEDETSGSTDEATIATGNGAVDAADDGREEVPEQDIVVTLEGEAKEHDSESPSTNGESQAVLDVVSNVLAELVGNEEEVPEVTGA